MTTNDNSQERRQFGRRPTYQHGWIKIPGRPALACVIRNKSEGGAMLMFDQPQCLPYGFILEIEGTSIALGCEVRHHYGAKVGVEFVDVATVQQNERTERNINSASGSWIESTLQTQRRLL